MSMLGKLFGKHTIGWWFAGPGLLMLVTWQIAPILIAGFMSIHRWKPIRDRYLGLQHYADLLASARFDGNVSTIAAGGHSGHRRRRGAVVEELLARRD